MAPKVSIITVVFNGERYLEGCILSVLQQDYLNIEYLIIDGGSSDGSLQIAQKYETHLAQLISEPDNGMYDAINKGIKLATGDIIGLLHADDFFADNQVISEIIKRFEETKADAVYGDLDYVDSKSLQVTRRWRSHQYRHADFKLGWMPAHPSLYIKKHIYDRFGGYSLNFGSAADYELMVRLLFKERIKAFYLPKLMIKMRTGGQSNATFNDRLLALRHDYAAARTNHIPMAWIAVILKKFRKVKQFFRRM